MLERHAKSLKINARFHGREVVLTDLSGEEYTVKGIFIDAEHAIKIDNVTDPIGDKKVFYIDRDSLQTDTTEIKPAEGWKLTGSANIYDDDADYSVEIVKKDKQLPGLLLFLSPINIAAKTWEDISSG